MSINPKARPPRVRGSGLAFMVASLMCFAALDTTTQWVAATAPVAMALWFRYLFQTVVTGAVLLPALRGALPHTRRPGLQFVRGLALLACSAVAFFGLRAMPVGEFTAVAMLTPLVITLIAAWRLGESVSWRRWACVVGGFAGTLLVIRPSGSVFQWALLLPLLLVVANTVFQIVTSLLTRTDDPRTMHFYTGLVGLVLTSAVLPWSWQTLPGTVWLAFVLMGMLGTLGHFLLILAYARAPVAVLTPYLYLQVGFAAMGGWLVFAHLPDALALAGIAAITLCGAYGTWLTAREARPAPQPQP